MFNRPPESGAVCASNESDEGPTSGPMFATNFLQSLGCMHSRGGSDLERHSDTWLSSIKVYRKADGRTNLGSSYSWYWLCELVHSVCADEVAWA
jgi:hypothetical protein